MNKEDPTQGIPVWLQHFTVNLEDLEAYVLAHFSERENSDSEGDASKVETQKRKHSIHTHFFKNQKRFILRAEKYGDLITTKDVNLGTISDTLPWYKFSPHSAVRVKPKHHKRQRRIQESSYSRRSNQKIFTRSIYKILASIVKNHHGIIEQLHFIDQRQAELQNELYVE